MNNTVPPPLARFGLAAAILLSVAAATPAGAQSAPDGWRQLAVGDVEALHDAVITLHPGIRDPETPDFAGRVEAAYAEARSRAETADSFLDWRAATLGFMLSFRDGHTIYRTNVAPVRVRWPGFLIDGREGGWVVRRPTGFSAMAGPPEGARLVSCDGLEVETLLRERLDKVEADWSKAPERLRQAYRLFIDYRTDGPVPLTRCRFALDGVESAVDLTWTVETWSRLGTQLTPFNREVSRPIGMETLPDGGVWFGLGSFGDETALEALATVFESDIERIRAAPYVVFDVRGNRGGNSGWGDRFATALWGQAAYEAREARRIREAAGRGGKFWRTSPEAQAQARATAAEFATRGPDYESVVGYFSGVADGMARWPDGDRSLYPDPCCTPDPPAGSDPGVPILPSALMTNPVFLLTDAACFSSCVLGGNKIHMMGAIQVGETTGQNEEYGEVAGPIDAPSGLGRYLIPLTIIRQPQSALVSDVDIRWPGALDDETGLRRWIAELAATPAAGQIE